MRDPVTDYEYPQEWVELCRDEKALYAVRKGLSVLTSSGKTLRRGFTTGTTAGAACMAAVISLQREVSSVDMQLPCGITVNVPVSGFQGTASAYKYSGDYKNDITSGIQFLARAELIPDGIWIFAGKGIGRFARDTPRYSRDDPAISGTAWRSIKNAVRKAMEETGIAGVKVALEIPGGEEIGRQTLNPRVGVEGGISVLGSTGFVEPWDDHLSESVFERAASSEKVVATTGRIGLRYSRMLFPDHEAILAGINLQKVIDARKGDLIICGLPALILKFINPGILTGTGYKTVEELTASPGWKEIVRKNLNSYKEEHPDTRIVIVNREGKIEGDSR